MSDKNCVEPSNALRTETSRLAERSVTRASTVRSLLGVDRRFTGRIGLRTTRDGRGRGTYLRRDQDDLTQHAVDEAGRIVGGQLFGQLDGFVDGDYRWDVGGVEQLPDGDAQDGPVHRRQTGERPVREVIGDHAVEAIEILGYALDSVLV